MIEIRYDGKRPKQQMIFDRLEQIWHIVHDLTEEGVT